ncbi:MAG TPA: glycoside hydrolase family 27 protein [Terriglobia bacterium]|jgi:alpha-galactosidase|nr:glycoside hydrolase family 27 protein [Terriglobia bacterium]
MLEDSVLGPVVSRRCVLRALAASPALLAGAPTLQALTDLSGYWVLLVPTGDGNYRKTFLHLEQSGHTVTGEVMYGARKLALSNGSFQDGKLHFEVVIHLRQQTRQVAYDGQMAGGKINMMISFPGRNPISGIAERTTREATLPPKPLPLPALRDLPDNGLVRTPPMGWNSWNKFSGRVDDSIVRAAADAMVASGMAKVGYTYINIDDTWQGQRDKDGRITGNRKFPDMKALCDYVHSKGLKIGIYSGPGPTTCAGYEGSFGHEEQDAQTYAEWGFDYLKYDWCSAAEIYKDEEMRPVYQKMGEALQKTGRPIVYSLCQYGRDDVWGWGAKVGGNLWRTTGDISDRWERMDEIGFSQFAIQHYMKPGHWNDPDMLEVGNGGMTNDEYRTHMSLWCLLAAPLLAGNDLSSMTEETREILMNTEVIAINQDQAANPAKLVTPLGKHVVAYRKLSDGSTAVAFFNRDDKEDEIGVEWSAVEIEGRNIRARDLWKHEALKVSPTHYSARVPAHGVVMLRVKPGS